ncbi:hypothetical protein FA95DRAFT_1506555, partial [Auriscalpium vulgare]
HDTVDDHCRLSNWQKGKRLWASVSKPLSLAQATEQGDIYTEFTNSLELDHPEKLSEWREKIHEWEAHGCRLNPYRKPAPGV